MKSIRKLVQSDAEAKLFDVAVATKIDRFSKSIADFYNFLKRLCDLGVDVVSATQQVDTTTSGGKFMLAIFLAFAEFERNIISERTKEIITKKGEKQGNKLFLKDSILRTLRNKTYIGITKSKEEEFKDKVEPIVDRKVFDQVQERLEEPKVDRQVNRVKKPTLSLLGITKCGLCGSNLTSQAAKSGKYHYYKCSKKFTIQL
ncbi:MAG: recombinase family protein [Ignavibacteriaceae bacterium]